MKLKLAILILCCHTAAAQDYCITTCQNHHACFTTKSTYHMANRHIRSTMSGVGVDERGISYRLYIVVTVNMNTGRQAGKLILASKDDRLVFKQVFTNSRQEQITVCNNPDSVWKQ